MIDSLINKLRISIYELVSLVMLIFMYLFYFYRYPFKINSTLTSPTYHNTPLSIQIFKYVLFFIFYLVLIYIIHKNELLKKIDIKKIYGKIKWYIFFIVYILISAVVFHLSSLHMLIRNSSVDFIIKFVFFTPLLLLPIFFSNFRNVKYIIFYLFSMFLLINVSSDIIQLILFFTVHRLPALAYSGGSVRFGGLWDDPNGSAYFTFLGVVYFIFNIDVLSNMKFFSERSKQLYSYIFIILSIIYIGLTFSFTAFILLFLYGLYLIYIKNRYGYVILFFYILSILVILFDKGLYTKEIVNKFPSAIKHFTNPTIVKTGSSLLTKVLKFFFGNKLTFSEDTYVQLFYSFGIIGFILFIYSFISSIFNNRRNIELIILIILFLIGSIGLPYFEIFPVNGFIFFLLGLYLFDDEYIKKLD